MRKVAGSAKREFGAFSGLLKTGPVNMLKFFSAKCTRRIKALKRTFSVATLCYIKNYVIYILYQANGLFCRKKYREQCIMRRGGAMPYLPEAIANEFLKLAAENNDAICPMRMQKLIYFAHGWFLALKDEPLITEKLQAWTYGPVIESLYHEFKKYGSSPIDEPVLTVKLEDQGNRFTVYKPEVDDSDSYTKALLKKIWEVYGKHKAIELSNLTHQIDSPWYYSKINKRCYIENDDIKNYFKKQIKVG